MANLTQQQCDRIANKINARARKRFNYKTPGNVLWKLIIVALLT